MKNSVFYCSKQLIPTIDDEIKFDTYFPVMYIENNLKVLQLTLQVTSHRIILTSPQSHALMIGCDKIQSINMSQRGFFCNKQYLVKLKTKYGKVYLSLKNYYEAKITIQSVLNRKAWMENDRQNKKDPEMYSGMFNKIKKQRQKIDNQGKVSQQAMKSFDNLFLNLRDLKDIMENMKSSTGQLDGQNLQVNKILKNIGFVNIVSKKQAGRDYIKHLAKDLYQICNGTLFQIFGGMVPLLDLFYFYNKKRQMELVSPDELLEACKQFQHLGYKARLVEYPNNIKMVESTTFDAQKDFQQNFSKYFVDYKSGMTAQQISRKKGLPLSIIQIKLKNATRTGKLAIDDRIQGVKYYKNLFMST